MESGMAISQSVFGRAANRHSGHREPVADGMVNLPSHGLTDEEPASVSKSAGCVSKDSPNGDALHGFLPMMSDSQGTAGQVAAAAQIR
jgi:hypothetical protein